MTSQSPAFLPRLSSTFIVVASATIGCTFPDLPSGTNNRSGSTLAEDGGSEPRPHGERGISDASISAKSDGGNALPLDTEMWTIAGDAPTANSYERLTGDIVRDKGTGLDWYYVADLVDEDKASQRCADTTRFGFDDFRLPTLEELFSIVDYNKSGPALDVTVWKGVSTQFGAMSSNVVTSDAPPKRPYLLDFTHGTFLAKNKTYVSLFCVRGTAKTASLAPRFTATSKSNEFRDARLNRTWTFLTNAIPGSTHPEASKRCDDLGLRLPQVKELFSLIDLTKKIAPFVKGTLPLTANLYWTETEAEGLGAFWQVRFDTPDIAARVYDATFVVCISP
ncbi:MAG: DUF1566 domain-containing protein [Polyangiaceae bacterium]|nr:DUF1566 domain-containing protein [Polyangiaceae bacterium]